MSHVTLQSFEGRGRPLVILSEGGDYVGFADALNHALAERAKVAMCCCSPITSSNWHEVTEDFRSVLANAGVRVASFVALGASSAIVQNLALLESKLVRTLVLVDAATRPHPSATTRFIDKIENILPLGLPLRARERGWDGKPLLHRLRCPVLIVTSSRSNAYLRAQALMLVRHIPSAWYQDIAGSGALSAEAARLSDIVFSFQDVPARCPQKNIPREQTSA